MDHDQAIETKLPMRYVLHELAPPIAMSSKNISPIVRAA